jgi:ElaB/YqjD/DUF883 family membrane-anchored ribosome-binding protein
METYFHKLSPEDGTRQKLIHDLRSLATDLEVLLKASAGNIADQSKAELLVLLEKLKIASQRIEEETVAGAKAVDRVIRRNPYPTMGIALLGGVILGVLIRGRD